ncbi:hypothetical protein HYU89_00685 [Candidatus Collierbacteria bacterium]|nr:hypothetical protein [Candidatus Collierbacteria bacterium]
MLETEQLFQKPEFAEMPRPMRRPLVEPCRIIPTKDAMGENNGVVVEVAKNYQEIQKNAVEGNRSSETTVYMTTVSPGKMKGYHGHLLRTSTYTLVGGKAEVHMLNLFTQELFVYKIDADSAPYRTITEPGYFIALKNIGESVATFIGVPNPPYNPQVNEQLELKSHEVETAITNKIVKVKRFSCTTEGVSELPNYDVFSV